MPDMTRSKAIKLLATQQFDLLIVGGGVFGATTAWQASKRGLKVALVEATDFGHGASAHSYKIIHGGIRYLQHLDLRRLFASSRERSAFMRMAPHLCEPLPIMIPTYGLGKQGKLFLGIGCLLYDLLTLFRNRKIKDPSRRIPYTRFVGKDFVLREYPSLPAQNLTGACIINDGRFYNPTRLVWSFCESAAAEGGVVGNYLSADQLLIENGVVKGAVVTDRISGERISVKSKVTLNATGAWTSDWLSAVSKGQVQYKQVYSRDMCFAVKRKSISPFTLAVQGETADPDAIVAREKRHLFMSPWRQFTLIGVWHKVTDMKPDAIEVTNHELQIVLDEINSAYPGLDLTLSDIGVINTGLVPFGENQRSDVDLSYGKRSIILDHGDQDQLKHLLTLIGLRYTMARAEGEAVLDIVQRKLSQPRSKLKTDFMRLASADYVDLQEYIAETGNQTANTLAEAVSQALVRNHGSNASAVIELIRSEPELAEVYATTTVTRAEVRYVCQHEMVESLSDVVFRRTDIATGGSPGPAVFKQILNDVIAVTFWDPQRQRKELQRVESELLAMNKLEHRADAAVGAPV